jgi:RES domain-containing protein
LTFDGIVWRIVPPGAFALHVGYILKARGRWNREGAYGCLYTALSEEGALGEAAKYLRRAGVAPKFSPPRDLVSLRVRVEPVMDLTVASVRRTLGVSLSTLTGDDEMDLETCRSVADLAKQQQYCAILSPSAALSGSTNLNLYIDGRADRCDLPDASDRIPVTPDMFGRFY